MNCMGEHFTTEQLQTCFEPDFDIGVLRWKVRPDEHFRSSKSASAWNKKYAGKIAGGPHKEGYISVRLTIKKMSKNLLAHRVIWQLRHGVVNRFIDHVNMVKTDNRLENLRLASVSDNNANRSGLRVGKLKGTTICKQTGRYIAQINRNNKNHFLGRFDTEQQAHHAYVQAAIKFHGEFARP